MTGSAGPGTRVLGRSGIEVSALGVGTWAIGGLMTAQGASVGYGRADDDESRRALRHALDLGVTLFDTADAYGAGYAETLLGEVLVGRRDEVVVATKWGNTYDPAARELTGADSSPGYVRTAVEASLRRLRTDRVDVLQLHLSDLDVPAADDLGAACESLVEAGLVRCWGWSTDDPERAEALAHHPRYAVVQHMHNVLRPAPEVVAVAEWHRLAALARSPLAMGVLTPRTDASRSFAADDIRRTDAEWMPWFADGRPVAGAVAARDAVRDVLTSGGRTLAQGALGWLWAVSDVVVPIPGCRTVAQVEDNAGAMEHGPLAPAELAEVERLLGRA